MVQNTFLGYFPCEVLVESKPEYPLIWEIIISGLFRIGIQDISG